MVYGLSVVKAGSGEYLVNYYRKTSDVHVPDFATVMCQLFAYAGSELAPDIFKDEPTMRDLSETEAQAVRDFRQLVLEKIVNAERP